MTGFLDNLVQLLVVFPAAALCYIPMKDKLRFSPLKTAAMLFALLLVSVPLMSFIFSLIPVNSNLLFLSVLVGFLFYFAKTVKVSFICAANSFFFSCAVMSFLTDLAFFYDAKLHPMSKTDSFSLDAALFQIIISCIALALLTYPLSKWGSELINNISTPRIWKAFIAFPLFFLGLNIVLIPYNYETLHINNVLKIYPVLLLVMLALMMMVYILFYHISVSAEEGEKNKARIRFFEMQESNYRILKKYMSETEKLRHDFRQTIRTLSGLAEENDLASLKKYISDYSGSLPEREFESFCENPAVNALLNYYFRLFTGGGVTLKWEISLPEKISVLEPDLCSLLGNVLENALNGCRTVKNQDERRHCLSLALQNDAFIYIVSINSFDGIVNKKDGKYLSNHPSHGIGLSSITMTAEKYHGFARFSHTENEFTADIMLNTPPPKI